MAEVKALQVITKSLTASFRYPHVQVGLLPTFEVPPPATIYGHLAGVIGEWFDPEDLEFAYVFEHGGVGVDLETAQPIERGSGRPNAALKKKGWSFPVNVECESNPQRRQFLFRPRLTLYLRGSEAMLLQLSEAFRSPAYAYVLGRSQDLATCLSVEFVDVFETDAAFFSHTLLPYAWRPWTSLGTTVRLPKTINYLNRRDPEFEFYLHVLWPPLKVYSGSPDIISRNKLPDVFIADPTNTREFMDCTLPRGLWFLPVLGPGKVSEAQ